jgi:hypothetical protein
LTWSNLKAAAKLELLFNKSASEANLLNTKSGLSRTTKRDQNITLAIVTLVTLHFATKIQLMACLYWRCLFVKPLATMTRDCTCLGNLGQHDTDRIISIWIVSPKVPKAKTDCRVLLVFFDLKM